MKTVLASSEVSPFAKTGGLADMCGSLPQKLAAEGAEICVFTPYYRSTARLGVAAEPVDIALEIPIGSKLVAGSLRRGTMPDGRTPIYFVEQDEYFDRAGLYGEGGVDYRDNCERFVFFCRAVLESIRLLELEVDLLHVNDWQTGLIPAYLKTEYRAVPGFQDVASLLTIHNLAYQGNFWHWDMLLTGLDWKYFNWREMEFHGHLNLLKAAIVFADAINAVSPTYAQEIQSPGLGFGLDGVLRHRGDELYGILNGVDYDIWNPETDGHLAENYGVDAWRSGKAACKTALQQRLGLPQQGETPLVGFVGRLAEQKGVDIITQVMDRLLPVEDIQWAILGSGSEDYERTLGEFARNYPHRVAVTIGFDEALAHQIEAGADIFLMPSRFEPSGLNQLYSLRYGTVPLVHRTGGLADTITDATPQTLAAGTANGFAFEQHEADAFEATLLRAIETYRGDADTWAQLVETGMRQDWSCRRTAQQYMKLYQETLDRVRDGVAV